MKIKTEQVLLTPDMAKGILKNNTGNRGLSKTRVKSLAMAIDRGEWQFNGDAIRIANTGKLLDGQHRLNAIIMANVAVDTLLITGLEEAAFTTIDQGAKRTAGDILHIDGVKNSNNIAAALRCLFLWINTGDPYCSSAELKPTAQQIADMHREYPQMESFVAKARAAKFCVKYLACPMTAFCWFAFSLYRPDAADDFFEQLDSGAGLDKGSSVLLLRDRLTSASMVKAKLTPKYKCAITFKAFKYFVDDKPLGTLKSSKEEKAPFSLDDIDVKRK